MGMCVYKTYIPPINFFPPTKLHTHTHTHLQVQVCIYNC